MKRIPKHEKMYANSPTLETDEKGNKYIKKNTPTEAEKKTAEVDSGTAGMQEHEGMAPHVRHAMERGMMHHRHETEHAMHDHGKMGDKKEMHTRHTKETADMHKRHEKESGKEEINRIKEEKKS